MKPLSIAQNTDKLAHMEDWVASYLGNGIIGGCFDYLGLQFQDKRENLPDIIGDTYFVSQYHYVHGKFGMDYALPIGRLQAGVKLEDKYIEPEGLEELTSVNQRLQMDEGVLYTDYTNAHGRVQQAQFFSQARKNLFVLKVDSDSRLEFRFKPIDRINYHYQSYFETTVTSREAGGCTLHEIPTNLQTTVVALKQTGNLVFVSVYSTFETPDPAKACTDEINAAESCGFDELLKEQQDWWKAYWNESNFQVPYPFGEIWQRANYYIGCSLADVKSHPPLVFGLARVQWPAYFPQDYFYTYRNLFAANHLKQASATSEFWSDILPHAKEYANRLFKLNGAVYPWTPTVFDWHDYHHDNIVPNGCYYEMHNSAYVVKMCWDYYLNTEDEDYLRGKAYPVIADIARMYASMTTIKDGRAHILYTPNKSQDEATGDNFPNFFDTMISAEYTLALAKDLADKYGDSELSKLCQDILDKGYVYDRLAYENIYTVYEGDTRTFSFQKHPVQLNPITYLPIRRFFTDSRVINYHKRRYEIGEGFKDGKSKAWTLGQFMLASARLRMPDELSLDIDSFIRCQIMDPEYIQTFESSRISPHFLTTMGLLMQAITETLLQTHDSCAEFFPCVLPAWQGQEIGFTSLRIPGGFLASASYLDGFKRIDVKSTAGGPFIFSIENEKRPIIVLDSKGEKVYTGPASSRICINTSEGHTYTILPDETA